MDEELLKLSQEMDDDECRMAVRWWLRLKERGSDPVLLREFADWFVQSPARQRAFAQVEALWVNVRQALAAHPESLSTRQAGSTHAVRERAK